MSDMDKNTSENVSENASKNVSENTSGNASEPVQVKVMTEQESKWYFAVKVILIIMIILLALFIGNKIYNLLHKDNQIEKANDMKNPVTVEQILKKDFGVKVDKTQANEISKTMSDSIPGTTYYKQPDRVVIVPGKTVMQEAETFKKETKGDIVITTDPNHPDEKVKLDDNKTYTLEQRSYKLYPDAMFSVTTYNDSSIAVGYDKRVKVFGNTGYVGVSILDDKEGNGDKIKYGVKLTVPH